MQIVGHHHRGEGPARQNKRPSLLEVGLYPLESGVRGEVGKAREIAIDRHDAVTAFEKQTGVATRAARDVEHLTAAGDETRKPHNPGGWIHSRILTDGVPRLALFGSCGHDSDGRRICVHRPVARNAPSSSKSSPSQNTTRRARLITRPSARSSPGPAARRNSTRRSAVKKASSLFRSVQHAPPIALSRTVATMPPWTM